MQDKSPNLSNARKISLTNTQVPKARDAVESDILLLTTLSCIIQKTDHLFTKSPENISLLDWYGYSVMRRVRELFVRFLVQEYVKQSLSISKDDEEMQLGSELQNCILTEEKFYDTFNQSGFEEFMEKSAVKNLTIKGNDLEKIKLEYHY